MNIRNLTAILFLVQLISCGDSNKRCVSEAIKENHNLSSFNYMKFTADFEDYLLESGLIVEKNKEEYREFFQDRRYCKIDYIDMISKVNNLFSTDPFIGGAYVECGLGEDQLPIDFNRINSNPSDELVKLIDKLSARELEEPHIKAFFIYEINVLIGSCE